MEFYSFLFNFNVKTMFENYLNDYVVFVMLRIKFNHFKKALFSLMESINFIISLKIINETGKYVGIAIKTVDGVYQCEIR